MPPSTVALQKWVLPESFVRHGLGGAAVFVQLQVFNLIHTCALSHLSLFVMNLLIASSGKG